MREVWGDSWIRRGQPDVGRDLNCDRSAVTASSPGSPPPPLPGPITDGEGTRARDEVFWACSQSQGDQEETFGHHVLSRVVDLYGTAPRGQPSGPRPHIEPRPLPAASRGVSLGDASVSCSGAAAWYQRGIRLTPQERQDVQTTHLRDAYSTVSLGV